MRSRHLNLKGLVIGFRIGFGFDYLFHGRLGTLFFCTVASFTPCLGFSSLLVRLSCELLRASRSPSRHCLSRRRPLPLGRRSRPVAPSSSCDRGPPPPHPVPRCRNTWGPAAAHAPSVSFLPLSRAPGDHFAPPPPRDVSKAYVRAKFVCQGVRCRPQLTYAVRQRQQRRAP